MDLTDYSRIKLYATHPHPCSYLEERESTTLFVDPKLELDSDFYSRLTRHGFRRSGRYVYRPHCQHCQACIPIRIPVHSFKANRSQKRCFKKNADLHCEVVESVAGKNEFYQLYERYICERHADGDMYPPTRSQFEDFLSSEWGVTRYLAFRDEHNTLVAVSVIDLIRDGVSAIYTYFDPNEQHRSLGVFSILWQIEWVKQMKLDNVYLGYWIRDCRKMSYKVNYRPFELYVDDQWIAVNDLPKD